MLGALSAEEAIVKYKDKLKGGDPYGMGEDVFINTQAALTLTEIDMGNGRLFYVFDLKTPGFPQTNFVG